ncbi:putative cysteine binding domain-containing protein [Cryptosporidium canis]|uniref:Cysteine binding domain-containing protein n=1 Tax=Cryptosporidium canis TaxID=195482 RepID=A0A9D5DFY4_9CRYT|nr:putative cysteine binding domain-containing protein [Cryptosporidium canis]
MESSPDLVDWAQCELCKKWRRLPLGMNPNTLPEEWVCTMNTWDKVYNSCNVPEEVVGVPHENLHLNILDQGPLYSDFQNRSLKGRKKNMNIFPSNTLVQVSSSKPIANPSLSHNQDIVRDFNSSVMPENLLNRDLIESLSNWSQELKHLEDSSSSDRLEKNFPSCWPSEYKNLEDIPLFRNKSFEGFEKSKSKNNNFSGNCEILSNMKISQGFPICIFKNNIISPNNHPLQGRSIITGSDVPIIFKVIGRSISGIFPVISKTQSIKHSNNYINNSISSSNHQKAQGVMSSINTNSLEFIPASRSDWDSPFVDLSSSLFTSKGIDFNWKMYREGWNKCIHSYSKLFPRESCPQVVPSYINEKYLDIKNTNPKVLLDEVGEQINVDILDLLPVLSWLESPSKIDHPIHSKISQSNLSIQSNRMSKKHSNGKNITRSRTRQLDVCQSESVSLLRRSSRSTSKTQAFEKNSSIDYTPCNTDKTCLDVEFHNSLQPMDKFSSDEINSPKGKLEDKLADQIVKDDSITFTSEKIRTDVENTTFNILNSTVSDNMNQNNPSETDQVERSGSIEVEEQNLNILVDEEPSEEKGVIGCHESSIKDQDSSRDDTFLFTSAGIKSDERIEEDEFILPKLGSHKRKNKLFGDSESDCDPSSVDDINELEEKNRANKKRLRKKSLITLEVDSSCNIDNTDLDNSKFKSKSDKSLQISIPKIEQDWVENNSIPDLASRTEEKNSLYIIPRKKSLEKTEACLPTSKSDPWIPKSDSVTNRRDNYPDDYSIHTQKRNFIWQADQKRSRLSDQRRSVQCPSSNHRNHFHQGKHRALTSYEPHKHYPRHRGHSEYTNHHTTNFFNNSHYYSQNSSPSNQLMLPTLADESSYEYSNFKGYLNSKYSSSSSSAASTLSRHHRGR